MSAEMIMLKRTIAPPPIPACKISAALFSKCKHTDSAKDDKLNHGLRDGASQRSKPKDCQSGKQACFPTKDVGPSRPQDLEGLA